MEGNECADEQQADDLVDHQRALPGAPKTDAAPFDGVHPVRLALVLEVVDLLQRHGYQRTATARSLARFLRHLNALVKAYEAGH